MTNTLPLKQKALKSYQLTHYKSMPNFLEKKLKKEYGENNPAVYGTMNKIGAMKGNKITAKGRAMEKKHAKDIKKVAIKRYSRMK